MKYLLIGVKLMRTFNHIFYKNLKKYAFKKKYILDIIFD